MATSYIAINSRHSRLDTGLFNSQRLKITVLAAAALCLLTYLWQVNTLSTKGFQIKNLEKDLKSLKTEIQQLELALSSEKSIAKVSQRIQELQLVRVEKVEYLRPLGSSVALTR